MVSEPTAGLALDRHLQQREIQAPLHRKQSKNSYESSTADDADDDDIDDYDDELDDLPDEEEAEGITLSNKLHSKQFIGLDSCRGSSHTHTHI